MRSKTNAVNHAFLGTASAVKILDADPNREYICMYAVSGVCQLRFGNEGVFADNHIALAEGTMWEPEVVITSALYFLGDASKLSIVY